MGTNKKNMFFTNTYITGEGRQNFLKADYLEDPLFTSFTFDIDFTTSPLFYTINNSCYGYPGENKDKIGTNIENALKEMRKTYMSADEGYDILPLYSADFSKGGDKLGFGIQQNVYMDLPLYGATEYIYMVDKRNGKGSQNDVINGDTVSNGGTISNNSYKLSDTVKNAVSESDKAFAEQRNNEIKKQIEECDKIINKQKESDSDETPKEIHDRLKKDIEEQSKLCNEKKIEVKYEGVNDKGEKVTITENLTIDELQNKVDQYKFIANNFENIKKKIANWINGQLNTWQTKIIKNTNENKCLGDILSLDYLPSISIVAEEILNKKLKGYTSDWKDLYIIPYIEECLKLYNTNEVYSGNPPSEKFSRNDDKNNSLLIKDNGEVIVRPSKIQSEFEKELKELNFINESTDSEGKKTNGDFNKQIKVKMFKEEPEWSQKLVIYLSAIKTGYNEDVLKTIILNPLCYICDIDTSFEDFDNEVYTNNEEKLYMYETALNNALEDLYGTYADGSPRNEFDPDPNSMYGIKKQLEEDLNNCEYVRAMNMKNILESSAMYSDSTGDSDSESSSDQDQNQGDDSTIPIERQGNSSQNEPPFAPQTVLDMLGFISGMKKMVTKYPYIINSITGLDTAYNKHYVINDSYLGSGDDKITLTCWESLDLRVSSMFNRYFNAIYDRQYRRERVPVNLRRFNCSIYVHDVRNFVSRSLGKDKNRLLELNGMYYSVVEFKFYDCEIVAEETGNIFSDISNEAPSEMKKTNFTFTYGNCVVNFVPNELINK